MKAIGLILILLTALTAADCERLEAAFATLDAQYRSARSMPSPSARYDYYYRYLSAGAEVMAYCRSDQRNYRYAEIVRKLRAAEAERAGLRRQVIEEQWKANNIKPIVKIIYKECVYEY